MLLPDGLILGAIPERADPADLLLSTRYASLGDLPHGSCVGTCSLRRQAQLLRLRPDLRIETLRGNVDTRLRKLAEGQYEAIVLAAAGLTRLGLSAPHMSRLEAPDFLPAVGQGTLGIECREDDARVRALLARLDHVVTRIRTEAERAFSRTLNGGCQAPIAGYATFDSTEGVLHLDGLVASLDGTRCVRLTECGAPEEANAIGTLLANELLRLGANELLPA